MEKQIILVDFGKLQSIAKKQENTRKRELNDISG